MSALEAIVERLEKLLPAIEQLASAAQPQPSADWPKTVEQFAAYVQRDVRTVQGWIRDRKLRARTDVRPALITHGAAMQFLENRPTHER